MDTEQKAPKGLFRVIGVDTFDMTDWADGDFDTKDLAIAHAEERVEGQQMMKMHVYDDTGKHLYSCGQF